MIAFTLDIDWAPDYVIEYVLDLFQQYKIKCTIFATHESSLIKHADKDLFEIGIHPDFNFSSANGNKTHESVLNTLKNIYPEAKGLSSHRMTQNSQLIDLFYKEEFIYDRNQFLPYWKNIHPYKFWNGFVRITFNWEDDYHWLCNKKFNSICLDLNSGLNILNFHPVHVFLNTENMERYNSARNFYQDHSMLVGFQNRSDVKGTKDCLISTFEFINSNHIESVKLIDLTKEAK
jgi:hypothetical protein